VYRLPGSTSSFEQELTAGQKWAGEDSAICRRGGAYLWQLDSVEERVVEVATSHAIEAPGVTVYRVFDLHPGDLTRKNGIVVTNPTRTLLDLSGVIPISNLERALESALRRRLTHMPLLLERYEEWRRRGRKGAAAWRKLLELRGVDLRITDSDLEVVFSQLVRKYRLPQPVRQFVVRRDQKIEARFDFAYPDAMVAIEVHGRGWHLQRDRWESDLDRHDRVTAMGWIVLHFTWHQVTRRQAWVAEQIRSTLEARARGELSG
jgi:very-short-patch-repair endonuclease